MADQLTGYESRQVARIAAWKAEGPSRLAQWMQRVRAPLGRLVGKAVPATMVRKFADKAEALVENHDGVEAIARAAGVGDVGEMRSRPLEECDRAALAVSARAQHQALMEGAAAGVAGIATELINVPVLIAAALRAIRRIGHCYGYALDAKSDRQFVLAVLELAMVTDAGQRQRLHEHLESRGKAGVDLDGVRNEIIDELLLEAVPILGDLMSVALDYAFMRRVDVTARRVFQERWLRDNGRVGGAIAPAAVGRRERTWRVARELVTETVYLGGYGVGFAATAPAAAAGRFAASRLPAPAVRGVTDGARDAAGSAGQFAEGWGSLAGSEAPAPRRAPLELPA